MKDNLSEALQKEMSRREFLTTVGYGVASLVGIAGVMRMLGLGHHHGSGNGRGYGASAYGK